MCVCACVYVYVKWFRIGPLQQEARSLVVRCEQLDVCVSVRVCSAADCKVGSGSACCVCVCVSVSVSVCVYVRAQLF